MKGTNVSAWMTSCKKLYGENVVHQSLEENGIPRTKVFTPLEDVDDGLCNRLMATIAKKAGVELADMWRKVGNQNVNTFFGLYSGFFKHRCAYDFLRSMNDVHKIVMRRFAGAKPPILDMVPISSRSAHFIYRSKRGMFDYFLGMVEGAAMHYQEKVDIKVISHTDTEMTVKLTFEKPITNTRIYWPNLILSLGVLRSVSAKIALVNALGMGALAYFTTKDVSGSLLFAGLSLGISLAAALALHMPHLTIQKDLKTLTKKDFSRIIKLKSWDGYQALNRQINDLKESVQKDFIGFNAMVDEMYTFNQAISAISMKMNKTSDNISLIVKELASGASAQAHDTEKSILILNDSLSSVKQISQEAEHNKHLLESAVGGIESSFEGVQTTARQIQQMLTRFEEIRDDGNELKSQAGNITKIVSMVSQISQQTKLLALNASIEAARAGGAAGKSFSVVATEVRMLSNRTRDAVENINGILTNFMEMIEKLVGSVGTQYTVLESESGKLAQAVQSSGQSNQQIRQVSDQLGQTILRLQAQSAGISALFEKMEGLAAIAQQNGAASADASQNVHVYTEQIKELTAQILVFDKLIQSFKEDLERYAI